MRSYVALDGQMIDLTSLSEAEQAFFRYCIAAYRADVDWLAMGALADGKDNPLVRATEGEITRDVWEHPLYRAIRDLEFRLAVKQGEMAPGPNDDVSRDPFATAAAADVSAAATAR